MSALGVRILSRLSRPAAEDRHSMAEDLDHATRAIRQILPEPERNVPGKTILDFGSGEGWHALAFGKLGARKVYGIDIEAPKIARSRARALERGLDNRVFFDSAIPVEARGACDLILSRDSMEHYENPERVLAVMKECLGPRGEILITFGPTWYSPYGAHMNYFLPIPWVHLLFSERSIMAVRSRFRDDGARRYHEVPGGLNRMSVGRFERLVRRCGLHVSDMKHHCVRGKTWLGKLPWVREFFINAIECRLA